MSTPTQHTPGPWKYHLGRGANPRYHVQTSGGYQIASTTETSDHPQAHEENTSRKANARLIAAAPELLAALDDCVNSLEELSIWPDKDVAFGKLFARDKAKMGRAAIAKARGKA